MNNVETKRGFKRKTIEEIIRKKMNHWISHLKIQNEYGLEDKEKTLELQLKVKDSYIVTGGAITSLLLGEMPNDFDVYFNNVDVAGDVVYYYLKHVLNKKTDQISKIELRKTEDRVEIYIKSAGAIGETTDTNQYDYFEMRSLADLQKYFEDSFDNKESKDKRKKYRMLMATSNAITLSDDIQLIFRFVGNPETIHKNYDFVHCTNYFTNEGGLVLNEAALVSILSRELKYVGSLYPLCSMFRLKKFIKRKEDGQSLQVKC